MKEDGEKKKEEEEQVEDLFVWFLDVLVNNKAIIAGGSQG